MTGSISHHECPTVGREVPVRDVDRDPLLAFSLKAVEDQCVVQLAALRANPPRVGLERCELILEQQLRFVQEPADERALAVIDASARDEAQKSSAFVQVEIGLDLLLDRPGVSAQKYPSCFFRSIDPDES